MSEFIVFVVLGAGTGAVYALLSLGVLAIYRGSGVVNFAQGAFALVGAAVFIELRPGVGPLLATLGGILGGGLLGLATQALVMRQLKNASPLTRVIASLGILITIQSIGYLRYGSTPITTPAFLPHRPIPLLGFTVQSDRLTLLAIAILVTLALAWGQRRTLLGLATRAAAENDVSVASLGWSPDLLAGYNWAIGGLLAGAAGALIVPLTGLVTSNLTLLIVPALAAALLGGFESIGLTLVGALGIGIAQALLTRYWPQTGVADGVPFLVIIVVLVVTGRSLPLRSHLNERLPKLGSGRVPVIPIAIVTVVAGWLMFAVFPPQWQAAFTVSVAVSVILLSVVVLTGYAGQLSLAQYAMAGLGAFVAGRLVAGAGWPFWAAALIAITAAVPIGLLFAVPALRTRGVNLAVVTLGLGVAVNSVLFNNVDWTGGFAGTTIARLTLFGLDITDIRYPGRYGLLVVVCFILSALLVANLRRGAAGRRLIAIRENERAAASLGVSVMATKLYAFALASGLAALGGILLAFYNVAIVYTDFDPFHSIYALAYAVIGGLGFVLGPLAGSPLIEGGINDLFTPLFGKFENYLPLIGGVVVVVTLLLNQDGIVAEMGKQARFLGRTGGDVVKRLPGRRATVSPPPLRLEPDLPETTTSRVTPIPLLIAGLTVKFGAVLAVRDLSLEVRPGEVVGLIGPNGAGKTTVIDAVSGFVRPSQGRIALGDRDLGGLSASSRVRAGLVRSWQSLELFEQVSILENLQVASESNGWRWWHNLIALVRPGRGTLTAAARAAITEFGLESDLGRRPSELPYSRRRLVGIARSVALSPSLLLLDEPAAGLSSVESRELGHLIRRLAEGWGMGVLLVEHDVEMVMATCDRLVVLNFGAKIADGPPSKVRNDPAVIAAYLGSEEPAASVSAL